MVYKYNEERPKIFTEDGVKTLLAVKSQIDERFYITNWVKVGDVRVSGDSFTLLACFDYLEELGYIINVTKDMNVFGQDRCYVRRKM